MRNNGMRNNRRRNYRRRKNVGKYNCEGIDHKKKDDRGQ